MTLSCSFIAAIIVFRLPWTWRCSKQLMKFIHAGLHMLAFVLTVVSMVAVFDFHNTAKIPNMYSLHSWLGLTALILYTLQVNELPFHVSFSHKVVTCFYRTRTRTAHLFLLLYWADLSWSRTVLDASCTSIVESCIHASPHLHWPFHLHLCDSCGPHGYYWETDFCPVSMKTWCLWKGFFNRNLTTTFLRYWCTTFVCYIQEQPEVQGFSSRGHICQHYWNAPGSLWGVHPLHCHSKILETAYWADPAQLHHQRGRWRRRVASVWRNRVTNSQWHQKENFKLEDQADWIQSVLVSWCDFST